MACVTLACFLVIVCLLTPFSAASDSLQDILFGGNYEFIDLSHTFNNDTVYWPGVQKFQFTKKTEGLNEDAYWYAANDFEAGEHGGTHIDAPYHFHQQGKYVAELPLDKLIVSLVIIDVSSKVNGDAGYVLYKKDLEDVAITNFDKPCVVVFKYGWSQYANDPLKYLGKNGTELKFPGLSAEVAQWVTSFKNIVGVGVDTPSVDAGANTDFTVHKILAKAGLYNMENVNLHRPISAYKCTALALPMKIGMGTGAPLRLVAICPKDAS